MDTSVKRGDIYYADLSPVVGSEQGGVRPVLIIQNDTGNRYSPTVIAAAITSQTGKTRLPTHIDLPVDQTGVKDGKILSTVWLSLETGAPVRGEIAVDGEILLTADFTSFSFCDTMSPDAPAASGSG